MQLDVGHSFSDKVGADGTPTPEMMVRNRWVEEGYQSVHHDVTNLSSHDLFYLPHLFDLGELQPGMGEARVLGGYVSANVRSPRRPSLTPPPFLIKELRGGRFSSGTDGRTFIRVGVVGVTERADSGSELPAEIVIDDPLLAARRAILAARSQSDVLVVLAYVSEATAFKLLDLNPEVDIVIAPRARWQRAYRGGSGTLVYADRQTKQLGELRVYLDETGHVVSTKNRYIMLDDRIPGDPATEDLVSAAHEEIAATVKAGLSHRRSGR